MILCSGDLGPRMPQGRNMVRTRPRYTLVQQNHSVCSGLLRPRPNGLAFEAFMVRSGKTQLGHAAGLACVPRREGWDSPAGDSAPWCGGNHLGEPFGSAKVRQRSHLARRRVSVQRAANRSASKPTRLPPLAGWSRAAANGENRGFQTFSHMLN